MAANPEAVAFNELSLILLNGCLRPYTARWHGWIISGVSADDKPRFQSEVYRRKFREELQELQIRLRDFEREYRRLANGSTHFDLGKLKPPLCNISASLGSSLIAGIGRQITFRSFAGETVPLDRTRINALEHEFISERRYALGLAKSRSEAVTDAVGLAFSGGGIRSATVCLGVLQVLARRHLIAQIDYLSTVSGGGYLGTFLTSFFNSFALHKPGDTLAKYLAPDQSGVEPAPIRHIRNNSRYLLHGGAWGKLNMAAFLLSGLATNILMVLPLPLIAVFFLYAFSRFGFWGHSTFRSATNTIPTWQTGATINLMAIGILLVACWIALSVVRRISLGSSNESFGAKSRGILSAGTVGLLVAFGFATILFLVPVFFNLYGLLEGERPEQLHLPTATVSTILGLLPFLSGLATFNSKGGRLQKLSSLLLILSGLLLYFWIILFVGSKLGLTGTHQWHWYWVLTVALISLIWAIFLVDINSGGPHGYYRDRLCECYLARRGKNELTWWQTAVRRVWSGRKAPDNPGLDTANSKDPSVVSNDTVGTRLQLPLTELAQPGLAPYHLVNTFVNLPASCNAELRGRAGDFFC
jgi:hypothetical protein